MNNGHAIGNGPGHSTISEQLERRLLEAWQSLWDNFVDPRESMWDDGGEWTALGSGSTAFSTAHAPFVNESQLRDIREQCRLLAVSNEFAINAHENRISYLVGSGHTYRAAVKKGRNASPELAERAQQVLDDFVFENAWHARQQEIVRRWDRDGEVFLRYFVTSGGQTRVRFVEPGQVATPPELGCRSVVQFWHSHRAGRRGNATGVLHRRARGGRRRDSASQGERRRQRETRTTAVLSGAQESAARREAACAT